MVISPKTKVLDLIGAYPELERTLVDMVPAFKLLKNPVLRKTVARVSTLQQAAHIGNLEVGDLVNRLRSEIGQEGGEFTTGEHYNTVQPAWFREKSVVREFNIQDILSGGEQPISLVLEDLRKMQKGELYKVVAPFLPAPLIDKSASLGFDHWINWINTEKLAVYFYKN